GRRATLPAMRSPHHSRDDQIHTHSSRMAAMDTLARLLETPRARDAFALRVVMSSPWSLRILAESPLALLVGVKGETWIVPDDGTPVRITPGDVAVTRAPAHFNVAGAPDTPPNVIIHPRQRCCDLAGNSVLEKMTHGIRTWGNDPAGSTVFVLGAYEHPSHISDR